MKSHKLLFASVLILISLLFSVKRVYATLVFINKQGELIVKVLSSEERAEIEKVTIELENDKFLIKQRSVVASTDYEININPKTAGISLKTPTGLKYLSILPRQAAETVLKSKLINK